jgi:hypothetical protein
MLEHTDVAILASRFDNSPLTIFEALSSGVPVITSDRVGTASWIEPENGLLTLPIESPVEFGHRAADALSDPKWMASGVRAASRMREKFSPQSITERLLHTYDRLMAARAKTVAIDTGAPLRHERRSSHIEGARETAVLAFADELAADPSLLRLWAQTFDGNDPITLVIHAPGWSGEDVARTIGPLVERAGLDTHDAADLLAQAVPASPEVDEHLAADASAVLTRLHRPAPFDALRTIDEESILDLRDELGDSEVGAAEAA